MKRPAGLYEQIVTKALNAAIGGLPPELNANTDALHRAEAADRIALHISRLVHQAIAHLPEKERVDRGLKLTQDILTAIESGSGLTLDNDRPLAPATVLESLTRVLPDGSPDNTRKAPNPPS